MYGLAGYKHTPGMPELSAMDVKTKQTGKSKGKAGSRSLPRINTTSFAAKQRQRERKNG